MRSNNFDQTDVRQFYMAFIKDFVFRRSTLKEFNQKIPIAFAAESIKCLQKSIQYVAASNTSESKVKIVANIFGGIAKQCNRIKTWFD